MPVKAVLFDLFNTVVSIEDDEVFYPPSLRKLYEALTMHGVNTHYDVFERVYFEVRDRLYAETEKSLEEPHFRVRIAETLRRLGYNFVASDPAVVRASEAFGDEMMRYVGIFEDAISVLSELHRKYKLGIVSNLALPEMVSDLFQKFGLGKFFDSILISGAVNKRKPSVEIFHKALAALNVKACEAVFVGDMPGLDVRGAKNAGIRAILIERRGSQQIPTKSIIWRPSGWDEPVRPDGIIRSLSELPAVLEHL